MLNIIRKIAFEIYVRRVGVNLNISYDKAIQADKSYVEGDKNSCVDLDVKSTEYAIKAFECFFRAVTFCPVNSPSARKKLIQVVQKIEKDNNLLPDEKGLECTHGFQTDFIGSNWKRVLKIGVHHCKGSLKDNKIIEDLSMI